MNKIGITGSTGSLGRIILKNKKKYSIAVFKDDITKRKKVFDWIKKNKLKKIIHLAAIVPIIDVNKNKEKAMRVNYLGTKNIVDACVYNNIDWLFFASTSHVYKQSKKPLNENSFTKPISYYGKTKLKSEKYIIKEFEKNNLDYCIGRIFSTANKNQKKNYLVPDLKKKIKESKHKIVLSNLNHYRDFISMEDIKLIIFDLMKVKFRGIINIASGKKTFLKDIARLILKKYKKKNYVFIDNKKPTSLIGNVRKLKKIINFEINKSIEKLIF